MFWLRTLLAAQLLACADAFLHPLYTPPIERSIQRWDLATLREQNKQHRVHKIAFHQDDLTAVEVLDTNGLQRTVQIFPEAVPYLMDDLRETHTEFFVVPPPSRAPTLFVAFARGFIATSIVVAVIDCLGMLGLMMFAMSVMFDQMQAYACAVGDGWELTLADAKNALLPQQEAFELEAQGIPVLVDDEPQEEEPPMVD